MHGAEYPSELSIHVICPSLAAFTHHASQARLRSALLGTNQPTNFSAHKYVLRTSHRLRDSACTRTVFFSHYCQSEARTEPCALVDLMCKDQDSGSRSRCCGATVTAQRMRGSEGGAPTWGSESYNDPNRIYSSSQLKLLMPESPHFRLMLACFWEVEQKRDCSEPLRDLGAPGLSWNRIV
ncbi:hypothetical protein VTK56DRAFT_7451 [Thermocarpiscus australiensis]